MTDLIRLEHKGFAPTLIGRTVADLAQGRPELPDAGVTFPMMVLIEASLEHNITTMADFCARHDVLLAPHGKTSMSPDLHARQFEAGAWALTAATVHQVAVYRAHGVRRVLLANELVDENAIRWLVGELDRDPNFELYCLVDSTAGVTLLAEAIAAASDRCRLPVLIEVGYSGGRAGCRDLETVLAVADRVTSEPRLRLAGVSGFEGLLGHDAKPATIRRVDTYLDRVRDAALAVLDAAPAGGGEPFLVSSGASSFFDRVVACLGDGWSGADVRLVLRCGSYVTHDHGLYGDASPFDRGASPLGPLVPALCTWAHVLSLPEPALAIVGAGRRDLPADAGLPVPLWSWPRGENAPQPLVGVETVDLNDHHAHLRLRDDAGLEMHLAVGDLVGFGISHPCTAFDKWRLVPLVDDEWAIVGAVQTYF